MTDTFHRAVRKRGFYDAVEKDPPGGTIPKWSLFMFINKIRHSRILTVLLLCTAIFTILAAETIINLTPPVDRDALIHHLAIPKLWLKNGGFYEIKWAGFSYFPMNVDILYLIPLYLNKDFLAKFIHMAFGLGTAVLIFAYLRKRTSIIAGLLGVVVFLSTPMIFRLSTEVYVDLGLIFFTTASIFALIRYLDGECAESRWLLISAVCMGLALGTKYNAMIVWFFLTLAVIFICSRQTGRQWNSIKYGAVFFLVSLVVFSPWLIKNHILTGNPFHPLMGAIFNKGASVTSEGVRSLVYGHTYMGLFQMRENMFGEGFWETLLIPVRYFFQGQDNSPRYFDGVLNPLLILLPPFAFMNKSLSRDKLLFLVFAAFVIITATFLDHIRIRYILPAIPVLCIMAVMGFSNILNWMMNRPNNLRYALIAAFLAAVIVLLGQNALYMKNYYQRIAPWNYVTGKESRDDFISRHVGSYPAMKFINQSSTENSRVRLLFLGRRGYYLDRAYEDSADMGMNFIRGLVQTSTDEDAFLNRLNSSGHTHWLVRMDLFHKFLQDNYSEDTIKLFLQRLKESMNVLYKKNGYEVYQLIHKRYYDDSSFHGVRQNHDRP